MDYNYKVYTKDENNKLHVVLTTKNYKEACEKEEQLNRDGYNTVLWQC